MADRMTDDELREIVTSGQHHGDDPWIQTAGELATELLKAREEASLAMLTAPPTITERPTDAHLRHLIDALDGTGDPLHVLAAELEELRARVAAWEASAGRAIQHLRRIVDEGGNHA